jgi:hypothetical protein
MPLYVLSLIDIISIIYYEGLLLLRERQILFTVLLSLSTVLLALFKVPSRMTDDVILMVQRLRVGSTDARPDTRPIDRGDPRHQSRRRPDHDQESGMDSWVFVPDTSRHTVFV